MNTFFEANQHYNHENTSWYTPVRLQEVKIDTQNPDQFSASYLKPDPYEDQ